VKQQSFLNLAILLIISFAIQANSSQNEEAIKKSLKAFKLGTYQKSIDELFIIKGDKEVMATKFYMMGLSYNRLQDFENSILSFQKAKKLGNKAKDLHYEYGQALYANSDLEKSRTAFQRSYKNDHKKSSSLYYVAHISQLLEQHKKAKKFYLKVIHEEKKDRRLIQVSRFQLAESLLAMAEKRSDAENIVKKYVLPQLEIALDYLPKSDLAKTIRERKVEIERRFFLDPNVMRNGKRLPKKRWNIIANQDISFDNNVTFDTQQSPTVSATETESFILNSYLSTSYLFSHKGLYTFSPRLDLTRAKHTNRNDPNIYTNDSYSITGSLNNTFEHRLFGKQATFHLDFGHTYYARDVQSQKKTTFFSRSHQLTIGETFNIFTIGPTNMTLQYQKLDSYLETNNFKNLTLRLEQTGLTTKGHMWLLSTSFSSFDNYNLDTNSTDQYSLNYNYYIPEIFYQTTLSLGMGISFLDTKKQKETRGTEKMYTPTISLIREINRNITMTLSNSYTKNQSLDKNLFDYKKNVSSLAFTFSY